MADLDVGNVANIVDRRAGRGYTGATLLTEVANLNSVAALKARLTALRPASYTAARMFSMTENDLLYALRVEGTDSGSI